MRFGRGTAIHLSMHRAFAVPKLLFSALLKSTSSDRGMPILISLELPTAFDVFDHSIEVFF